MKQYVFADTDIVLDLLARRDPFYAAATKLFTLAETARISLSVSSLTFANLFYILRKQVSGRHAHEVLRDFKQLVHVLPVDYSTIGTMPSQTAPALMKYQAAFLSLSATHTLIMD